MYNRILNIRTALSNILYFTYSINFRFIYFFIDLFIYFFFIIIYHYFQGILGSGFALQVAQNQKQKHFNRRRVPAALIIQVLMYSKIFKNL